MPQKTEGREPADPVRIEGEMTIYRAAELKHTLADAVVDGVSLTLDLATVSELDTAGLQLLLWARRLAAAHHGSMRITAASPAVEEVLELTQLSAYFRQGAPADGGMEARNGA